MRKFQQVINSYKKRYNLILAAKNLSLIIALYLVLHNLFFVFYSFTTTRLHELFLFGVSLKIVLGLAIIYLILELNNRIINTNKAARYLDLYNGDDNDTYQNAWELLQENSHKNRDVIDIVCYQADKKAATQLIKPETKQLKAALHPLIISVIVSIIFGVIAPASFTSSLTDFSLNRKIEPAYKDYVLLSPGDVSVTKNSTVEVEVLEPETALPHTIFFRNFDSDEITASNDENGNWRSETLYSYRKQFHNIDRHTEYYVSNRYATSDTFRIMVFEEPAVREMTLRYVYPAYTGIAPETEYQSNGNIRALRHTKVSIEIEANNALEEALLIFSDGSVKTMERLGRAGFKETIDVLNSGTYHIKLKDFLGNESRRIDRTITVIADKAPEIRIVYPGRDTIFTQNLLQRLRFFASDDYGLRNLILNYRINDNDVIARSIRENIPGNIYEHDFIFDLSNTYMLPGDVVTYWAQITDNAPQPQTSVSTAFRLRFPSVEEIFAEIQREEEQKMDAFREGVEQSRMLQEDFERTRRDMMKKSELDWEDKKELEQFLERQEDLNKMVEKLSEEYQNLLEKFEDNPFLSPETLEKMERIRELMEEIADDRLKSVMENMQMAMERMDRNEILKLMEEFKFSMEDFNKKLENTLQLLESIKKEQNLQKALAISKEMEQMQQKLLERTESNDADAATLAKEQQAIQDKLNNLKEQLEQTMAMMDQNKDSDVLQALQDLLDKLNEDGSLQDILSQSQENLQQDKKPQAAQNQQQALQQMQQMSAQLQEMSQMMMAGNMSEMQEIVQKTVRRLLTLSQEHQTLTGRLSRDPFPIYSHLIANFDTLQLILHKLYSSPEIVLFITPKFIMDADNTITEFREMFHHIINIRNPNISNRMTNIQKGINLMIFNLMQTADNMQQGGAGGMESLMQALQQMGQEQMGLNMMTQQLLEQMGQGQGLTREMRQQMQRIAAEEERLAENLRRLMETNPEAQRQANAINQMLEELQAVSRQLRQNRLDESLIKRQERILSRLLDAQKSINQREYSRRRRGETREDEEWELPAEIRQEFQRLRQQSLLQDSFRNFPKEYRELIREYLRILNQRASEQE